MGQTNQRSMAYLVGREYGRLGLVPRIAIALLFVAGLAFCTLAPFVGEQRPPLIAAPPAKSPPTAAELAREKEFRTVVAGARWLKENMKNPASFELISAGMIDGKVICYEYRGTNSFNAIVPNFRVITDNVNSGEAKDWNKYCAGKLMTDYTYARRVL